MMQFSVRDRVRDRGGCDTSDVRVRGFRGQLGSYMQVVWSTEYMEVLD